MKLEKWQITISLLTLLITPIASGFVVYYQLDKSHSYWLKQQIFLQSQESTERRFNLYENCALELGQLKSLLLDQQIFLHSKNECEFLLYNLKKPNTVNVDYVKKEHERYRSLIFETNEKIGKTLSKIGAYNYLGKAYFGDDYEKEALKLLKAIRIARKQVFPSAELIDFGNKNIDAGKSIDVTRETMGKMFDSRWESLHLNDSISVFLNFIFEKLNKKMHNTEMTEMGFEG